MSTGYRVTTGFSLVELMIALGLGALLLAAVIQFAVSYNTLYQLDDSFHRVQENGRLALDLLARDLRLAGYGGPGARHIAVMAQRCPAGGQAGIACARDNAGSGGDVLTVRYAPPASVDSDCTGRRLADRNDILVNVYSVADLDGDGIRSLYCRGFSTRRRSWLSRATPLVDGIDTLQVLYRVSAAGGDRYSFRSVDRLTAQQIDSASAIQVALLVNSGLSRGRGRRQLRRYQVVDSPPLTFSDDGHLRRIFRTTVFFHNHHRKDPP